jgi:hydrogenase maturation protease
MHNHTAPVLVFAYGNPSRGDDALGPAMFDLLEKHQASNNAFDDFELLVEYQLQIEHAIDLEHRKRVLFIDASTSCAPPYEFSKLQAKQDDSYTTHAMSPASVMAVYQKINEQEPPPSYLITIRGYEFDLGREITEQAVINLQEAYEFIKTLLKTDNNYWPENTGRSDSTHTDGGARI